MNRIKFWHCFEAIVATALLLVLFFTLFQNNKIEAYHLDLTEEQRLDILGRYDLDALSPISVKNFVYLYGQWQPLYKTFDNRAVALFRLKQIIPEYLELLQKEGDLGELSAYNWKKYNLASIGFTVDNKTMQLQMKNYFECFIDIYENNEINYYSEININRLIKRRLDLYNPKVQWQFKRYMPNNFDPPQKQK